ncbi:DNA-binding protein [Kitasatospora sp. NPDC085464]|uniref:DNA-binding protein n=1 Tax=Kitasatospora sp. NPDC085464 TaxID=3364063 RepID=UPI0037C76B93
MPTAPAAPVLVTGADAAHLVKRPIGTVRRWASEGRITSYDGLYDWRELQPVARGEIAAPPLKTAVPVAA